MRKELDVLQEKHSLFKVADAFAASKETASSSLAASDKGEHRPAVKLVATFSDPINLYLLMEMLEGKELWAYTRTFGIGSPTQARYIFYKILQAVEQIHELQIVHRDLKVRKKYSKLFSLRICFSQKTRVVLSCSTLALA